MGGGGGGVYEVLFFIEGLLVFNGSCGGRFMFMKVIKIKFSELYIF